MSSSDQIRLQVFPRKSIHYDVYVGSAKFKDLAATSYIDRAQMDTGEGVQRNLDAKHAADFAKFVKDPSTLHAVKATAPPLIFSLRKKTNFEAGPGGLGTLTLPRDSKAMVRLDAQHRLHNTASFEEEIPFQIYKDLTPEEELAIFTIFNDKHKGLSKSLVDRHTAYLMGDARLSEEEPHLAIAKRLNSEMESPWLRFIDTGGEKTPGTKRRVSLRTMQQATRTLVSGARCQSAAFEKKYEAVQNYWKTVKNLFPDEWDTPRNNLLTKGVGVHALCGVGREVLEECFMKGDVSTSDMEIIMKKLVGFDWNNKTSVLAPISGQKGVKIATALLNRIVFGGISPDRVFDEIMRIRV